MKKILLGIGGILILGALWYLVSPVFIDKEVDDTFPEFEMPRVNELESMNKEDLESIREEALDTAAQEPATEIKEMLPEEDLIDAVSEGPQKIVGGEFIDIDFVHKGSGKAGVYQIDENSRILRFEDFEVTNGPALHVVLSAHPNPKNQSEVKDLGFLDLGNLKGNKGNQNYELDPEIDLSLYKSVVIYCYPFNVVFSTATLQ